MDMHDLETPVTADQRVQFKGPFTPCTLNIFASVHLLVSVRTQIYCMEHTSVVKTDSTADTMQGWAAVNRVLIKC